MTLRQLYRMALARQREAWTRTAVMVAWIVNNNGMVKDPIRPVDVIPAIFRYPVPEAPPKSPEEIASESRRGWKLLDQFMTSQKQKKKKVRLKGK